MAQLHGKQIQPTSVSLNKLSGTGLVNILSGNTMSFNSGSFLRTDDLNISTGLDVVNKNYVDAVASGLDAKVPVRVVTATGSVTLSGVGYQIDGFTISISDRILVVSQAGINVATNSNGIYVADTGAWSRAVDSDGNPITEVSHGNFVFVTDGSVYEHTGWVLTGTDATNPDQILVGTNSQLWVQFSEQANIRAGNGLTFQGQTLNVGAGTGISVGVDDVSITNTTVVAGNYGTAGSVGQFTVNPQGQLVGATSLSIDINSGQVNDFSTATENVIFQSGNFVDGSTVDFTVTPSDLVTAEVKIGTLTASRLNIINPASASQNWKLGYNTTGQFEWFDPSQSDISEVIAGNGLSGGGLSGAVTLNANVENGIDIVNDFIGIGGTMSRNTTINGDSYDITLGNFDNIIFTASVFDVMVDGLVSIDAGTGSVQISGDDGVLVISPQNEITLNSNTYLYISTSASQITTTNLKGLEYVTDYSATFVNNSLVTKKYTDDGTYSIWQAINSISGDAITGVTAGAGLSGGGSSGFVTLDVNVNPDSLEIDGSDNVRLKDTITGNRTFQDSVTVGGNLTVNGTVSYINTENLYVEDNIITLNATWSGSPLLNAGIEVIRGASQAAALIWDESLDLWAAGLSGSTSTIITEAGTGLSKSGKTLSVDFVSITGTGLTQNGTQISVDTNGITGTLAGAGLAANGAALDVNTTNGLSIISDSVGLGGTLSQNTIITGNGNTYEMQFDALTNFKVTNYNGKALFAGSGASSLQANVGAISLTASGLNQDATISATGTASLSADTLKLYFTGQSLVTDASGASYGLVYVADYSAGFINNSLITKKYVDDAVSTINADFITGVTAGAGLIGGGDTGFITLDIETTTNKGLTFSTAGIGGTLEVLLTPNGGLTFSNGGIIPYVDNTTIQVNGSGQLTVVAGASTPVYDRFAGVNTSGDGAIVTGVSLTSTPNDYSRVQVYVNGQLQRLGDGVNTLDCYFGSTPKALNSLVSADQLYWNGLIAGFDLSSTDIVEIVYES